MSGKDIHIDDGVLMGHVSWEAPLCVSLPGYQQFTRRIDVQLRQLVARWAHAAAPNARRTPAQALNRRGWSR
jgi:hypothetical protein